MQIQTTRFGVIEVDQACLITFPNGLLGFPEATRFVLIEHVGSSGFYWLQSVDTPDLAFAVTDPTRFDPQYDVPVRETCLELLQASDRTEIQLLVVVNRYERQITGNFQGPLAVNVKARLGEQIVVSDKRYDARTPLMETPAPRQAMSA